MFDFLVVRKRGTETGAKGSRLSEFQLAQYLATLILGAGVFLLPLEASRVGLAPLVVMLLLILWPCIRLYQRVAALMVRRDPQARGGGEALARAVIEAGGGRAGAVLSLIGIAVYVCGAAVVYNRLGLRSLELLAAQLGDDVTAAIGLAAVAVLGVGTSLRMPVQRVITRRLLMITSVWGIAAPLVMVLHGVDGAEQAVGLIAFAVGCLVVNRGPVAERSPASARSGFSASHSSSIVALRFQLVLMALMAVAALALVAVSSGRGIHWDAVWVSGDFRLTALLGALAVVLFAHVGTGMSNVAEYAPMGDANFRRAAVRLSLVLVTAVLLAWLVPTVLIFGHAGLATLVDDKTNSALGLSSAVIAPGSVLNGAMSVLAAIVTLIAVTNANAGFVTSLARELIGAQKEIRPEAGPMRETLLTPVLIGGLAAAAGGAIIADDSLAPMLHIAGIVGGGVIVFTLPILAESGDRRSRVRSGLGAVALAIVLGAWATAAALTESGVSTVVEVSMIAVGWSSLVPTALAARGVIRAGKADERSAQTRYAGTGVPGLSATAFTASRKPSGGRS